ncbi:colicin D domain-containing protein [Paraburkholderia aromaticivorans]|uniref:colicin D domain-containing protein n=1 Tax=Paraburkholderia aromaticivorans TaxID=2026199 RepID=UPI0012FD08E2|nr:colicin D domain-containing protein [Paraburkholderia aromaticivorans]
MNFTRKQLDKKFKHAVDFSVTGNKNGSNIGAFEKAMKDHVDLPSTQAIQENIVGPTM